MDLTMMLFLHDFSLPFDDPGEEVDEAAGPAGAGPSTPRPADPAPEGQEGEPVGDDDEEPAQSTDGLDG